MAMQRLHWKTWTAALVILALGGAGQAAETAPGQRAPAARAPKLYALCMEISDAKRRSIPQQAEMLRSLGFDGVGYPLWLDESLETNLRTLDKAGLEVYLLYTSIDLSPNAPPYDPRLAAAIRRLKGRPVTICVLLRGFPPGDPRGEEPAVKILRQLGDLTAESGLQISVYHHTGDWTESLIHALRVVAKTNHPRVGANFNLCHWLMVDGAKDYRPVLRENAAKIFAVTINGAKLGTKAWTNGLIQPLDQGDFDNRALLATLREIGYRGPIGLMCYGIPGDAQEHLERSMKVWKDWRAAHPSGKSETQSPLSRSIIAWAIAGLLVLGSPGDCPHDTSAAEPGQAEGTLGEIRSFQEAYDEALARVTSALEKSDAESIPRWPSPWNMWPRQWLDMRFPPLLAEVAQLAPRVDDDAVGFLRQRVLAATPHRSGGYFSPGPLFSFDARLAVLTLAASTPQDRAAKELERLIEKDVALALYGLSLLPPKDSVPVLTRIAERYTGRGEYLGHTAGEAIVLLTIVGGKQNHNLLKALDDAGKLKHLGPSIDTTFHDYVVRMEKRLALGDPHRWATLQREDLLYWQGGFDRPPHRIIWLPLFWAGWRHARHGVTFSEDYLRSRLPERYAIAVVAAQQDKALIPDLKALAEQKNRTAEMARLALKIIEVSSQAESTGSKPPPGSKPQ